MSTSTDASVDYEPVKVHLASSDVALTGQRSGRSGYRAHYETFTLTANDPVQCILPEDPDRCEAYVVAIDTDIVIGTSGQCGASLNTVTSVPQPIGSYIPKALTAPFPVKDCNAVYAGVTSSSSTRVSVAAYYRS